MKKFLLSLCMALCLSACGEKAEAPKEEKKPEAPAAQTQEVKEKAQEKKESAPVGRIKSGIVQKRRVAARRMQAAVKAARFILA